MIAQPIPYFRGQYATFSDTLPIDDLTEALTLTKPDGSIVSVPHSSLTRTPGAGTVVTYSWNQLLDQAGAWTGQFSSTGAAANIAPVAAYVV